MSETKNKASWLIPILMASVGVPAMYLLFKEKMMKETWETVSKGATEFLEASKSVSSKLTKNELLKILNQGRKHIHDLWVAQGEMNDHAEKVDERHKSELDRMTKQYDESYDTLLRLYYGVEHETKLKVEEAERYGTMCDVQDKQMKRLSHQGKLFYDVIENITKAFDISVVMCPKCGAAGKGSSPAPSVLAELCPKCFEVIKKEKSQAEAAKKDL
jgi:hypothetical protein